MVGEAAKATDAVMVGEAVKAANAMVVGESSDAVMVGEATSTDLAKAVAARRGSTTSRSILAEAV